MALIMCKNFIFEKQQNSIFTKLAILTLFFTLSFSIEANAQGFLKGLADRAKDRIKEKIENKVDRTVENATDRVLNENKSAKKNKENSKQNNNEEYSDYSEDTSSNDYEESIYEETYSDAEEEGGNITQMVLTDWCVLTGVVEEGVQQIALVTESQERKLNEFYETFGDKFTGNLQEQMLKRKLDENNKALLREFIKKAKSYSLGNRFYSQVFFLNKGDLIVVSTSQKPAYGGPYGEWGAINKNGKVVIPLTHFQFTRDASWMDALLFVDKEHGKIGAYHLNGKLRIPFKYEVLQPERTKHKNWFITWENNKNVLYDENMNKKLVADDIKVRMGTLNGKDDIYIYTCDGTGSRREDFKNYDENLSRIIEQ